MKALISGATDAVVGPEGPELQGCFAISAVGEGASSLKKEGAVSVDAQAEERRTKTRAEAERWIVDTVPTGLHRACPRTASVP